MSERAIGDQDLLNLDSFADIMTNVVAILVIVVMVGIVTAVGYEARPRVAVGTGVTRPAASTGRTAFYFACRNQRVIPLLPVSQVGSLAGRIPEPGDVAELPHYRAIRLAPGAVAFEPRPGEHGTDRVGLHRADFEFLHTLASLDADRVYLVFLVEADSFGIFREARELAETRGFATAWRPRAPDREGPDQPPRLTGSPPGTILFTAEGRVPEIQQ